MVFEEKVFLIVPEGSSREDRIFLIPVSVLIDPHFLGINVLPYK